MTIKKLISDKPKQKRKPGGGRKKEETTSYTTTLPKAKLALFLKHHKKIELNKCLREFINERVKGYESAGSSS